ncbi:UNVERIFIED_CONTAM: hypothetical protein B566_EDAN019102, partial [Ephemera danica]
MRFDELPKGPYTLQLNDFPNEFNEASIKEYTENKCASKHFTRGYIFFNSKVKASYDGKVIYPCFVVLEKNGTVRGGQCKCKSGSGGVCSHLKSLACTEKPQSWGHGAKNLSNTAEYFDLLFIKHNPFNKNNRSRMNIENRRKKRQNLKVKVTTNMLQDMHERLMSAGLNSVLCKSMECNNFQPVLPVPVQENHSATDSTMPINIPNQCLWESDLASLIQNEAIPFQYETISIETCWDIEKRTRNQSDCKEWQEERGKILVTASKFHKIINRKKVVTPEFLKAIFGEKLSTASEEQENEQGNLYTRLGLLNEEVACTKYSSAKAQNDPTSEEKGVNIYKCGLVINPGVPFLGASPDRVIFDKQTQEYGLLEIKTLSKAKTLNLNLQEAITMGLAKNLSIQNEEVKLKDNSEFHTQMQGQMALTGLKFCDLIVDCGIEFYIERFFFNEKYWKGTMLPKLTQFCIAYHPREHTGALNNRGDCDEILRRAQEGGDPTKKWGLGGGGSCKITHKRDKCIWSNSNQTFGSCMVFVVRPCGPLDLKISRSFYKQFSSINNESQLEKEYNELKISLERITLDP